MGLVAGVLTGHVDVALPLGIILELFWLDVIALGAVVPPVASLSFFLVFCTALVFDWHEPAQLVLPLLLALPCAYLGSMVERWQYRRNDAAIERLKRWITGGNEPGPSQSPARNILHSLVNMTLAQGALFLSLYSLLYWLLRSGKADGLFSSLFSQAQISWTALYGFAAIGAILALRTRRAYAVLAACISVLLLCNGFGLL